MHFFPILSTLRRHRTAAVLIILEIALTCAIVCNAIFLIRDRLQRMDRPSGVVFGPDNATLYSIGFDRHVRVWDVAGGTEKAKWGPTPDDLYGISLSRDGKQLATSGYGGNVTVWNLADGKPAFTKKLKFGAYCVIFTPDGKALVTGHDDKNVYVTQIGGQ